MPPPPLHGQGVKKVGLISRHIGDSLLLGPIGHSLQQELLKRQSEQRLKRMISWQPQLTIEVSVLAWAHSLTYAHTNARACAHTACPTLARPTYTLPAPQVSYLLSPRDDFGALKFECLHCNCRREVNTFAKQLQPFPGVDTDSRLSPNSHYRHPTFNATITASTQWRVYVDLPLPASVAGGANLSVRGPHGTRAPHECFLRVTHRMAGTGLSEPMRDRSCHSTTRKPPSWCTPRVPSRVRLDNLNIWSEVRRAQAGLKSLAACVHGTA